MVALNPSRREEVDESLNMQLIVFPEAFVLFHFCCLWLLLASERASPASSPLAPGLRLLPAGVFFKQINTTNVLNMM